jgi:hypothetical protein
MLDIASAFWPRVWRCTHRHCRQCCWPWGRPQDYSDPWECWLRRFKHASFFDKTLDRSIAAHRMAYILAHDGMLMLPGRAVMICHACDYGYCCNPAHLSLGTAADNAHDKLEKRYGNAPERSVLFPDGRRILFVKPRGVHARDRIRTFHRAEERAHV